MRIVDASLAVKWFVQEAGSDRAVAWLERYMHELIVPDIFFSEVGNALWRQVRKKGMALHEAGRHLQSLSELNLPSHRTDDLIQDALHYAHSLNHDYVYDCVYLALAVKLDVPLVTADEKFIKRLASSPWKRHVFSLGRSLSASLH